MAPKKSVKKLPEKLRETFSKPIGPLFSEEATLSLLARGKKVKRMIIAVGDTCSFMLLKNNFQPDIIVYDLKNLRVPVSGEVKKLLEDYCNRPIKVKNPPGTITFQLVKAIRKVLRAGKGSIFVDGEEDLSSLLVLLFAPLGSILLYGQPREGIVLVEVNNEMKKLARELYEQFE